MTVRWELDDGEAERILDGIRLLVRQEERLAIALGEHPNAGEVQEDLARLKILGEELQAMLKPRGVKP